jgi:repressor of nif and glnA expression
MRTVDLYQQKSGTSAVSLLIDLEQGEAFTTGSVMSAKRDRAKLAILKALHEAGGPAGAVRIMDRLRATGVQLQPRTIRQYLLGLDKEGLTRPVSRRRGREITDRGREEVAHANVVEKVGFVAAKVDELGYRMSFDNDGGRGTIIANAALIDRRGLAMALKEIRPVFASGLGMGTRLTLAQAGEELGGVPVPDGQVGIGTVCSVTVNGIMLKEGIPVTSRFGGLLEMRDGNPIRFVELIEYEGTTLDPLEAFIRAGMTQVRECARTGSGMVGASFREIPSVAVGEVRRLRRELERRGLGGILAVGDPNRPLLDIPVGEGRAGMVVVGGLNPVAAVHESGIRLTAHSLAGLEEFREFQTYTEVCDQQR